MIPNKHFRIHRLSILIAGLLSLAACGTDIINDKPRESKAQVQEPAAVEVVVRDEPAPIENSEPMPAAPEPTVPAASPIREGVPDRYVVKKGDTLWDISSHFLKDPWLWPEVWYVNPKIRNPHLIYPGDVIALTWRDGKPTISLVGAEAENQPVAPLPSTNLPVVKLSPSAREEKLRRSIQTIPKSVIAPFLTRPFILSDEQFKQAPYIVANFRNNVISGIGKKIYVRPIDDASHVNFNIVRKGQKYIDPDSGKFMGWEAINLGQARLQKLGDPATMMVTAAHKEILTGDVLIPIENEEIDLNFFPRAPSRDVAGRIISVADGVQNIGQYAVVVINKGKDAGLEPGHVLEIHQAGEVVRSPRGHFRVRLPEERAGLLMIFKAYDEVSYGLVMEAFSELKVYDYVYSP